MTLEICNGWSVSLALTGGRLFVSSAADDPRDLKRVVILGDRTTESVPLALSLLLPQEAGGEWPEGFCEL